MSNLVRATHPHNGGTFTTSEAYAKRKGLDYTTEGATDDYGRVRPPSPRTDKAGRAAPKVSASMKRTELEQAARDAGVPAGKIKGAKTKTALAEVITSSATVEEPAPPAPADTGAVDSTTDAATTTTTPTSSDVEV